MLTVFCVKCACRTGPELGQFCDKWVTLCGTEPLTVVLGFAEEYGAGPRMVRRIVLHIQLCQNTKHMCQGPAVLFNVPPMQVLELQLISALERSNAQFILTRHCTK